MSKKLTPTSFALLGFLSRQPYSAYTLAERMKNSIIRGLWPRAESAIYTEPKILEKQGLVESFQEKTGKRSRKTYRITAAGQQALQEWLASDCAPMRIEYEALVRLMFSQFGTSGELERCLQRIENDLATEKLLTTYGIQAELANWGVFPGSETQQVLLISFFRHLQQAKQVWLEEAKALAANPITNPEDAQARYRELASKP